MDGWMDEWMDGWMSGWMDGEVLSVCPVCLIRPPARHVPDAIVGDLDSVRRDVLEYYERHNVAVFRVKEQDDDDLHKAVTYIRRKYETMTTIVVLGGLGGNLTQELANFNVFYNFPQLRIFFVSNKNIVTMLDKGQWNVFLFLFLFIYR